ncbi:hypothetical protein KFL_000930230 [Klebsormidium nitens]|uniref:Uncharacterized protein n=1 Tax=Klebsormidium nitens TaxID=105231 RepID=A0A1Y1HZB7_KLENI|nr:hypothetical protein KFL_000930230 [Klebsormidium nitens]|eukprot:GAQ81877.1 hypothetical protein KFL_000930230 [Klebsormidium nitens]
MNRQSEDHLREAIHFLQAGQPGQEERAEVVREQICDVLVKLAKIPPVAQRVLVLVEEELAAVAHILLERDVLQDAAVAEAYEASFSMLNVADSIVMNLSRSWTETAAKSDEITWSPQGECCD